MQEHSGRIRKMQENAKRGGKATCKEIENLGKCRVKGVGKYLKLQEKRGQSIQLYPARDIKNHNIDYSGRYGGRCRNSWLMICRGMRIGNDDCKPGTDSEYFWYSRSMKLSDCRSSIHLQYPDQCGFHLKDSPVALSDR